MVVISFIISSISPKSFSFLLISYMYFYYNEAIILTCSSFWECFPFVHCVTVILIFFVEQMAQWLRKHQLKKQHQLSLPLKQNPVLLQLCLVSFIPQILTSPESVHSPLPAPPNLTAALLAQLGERRSAEREVAGLNPGWTNTKGL